MSRQVAAFQENEVLKMCREIKAELPDKQRTCFHDKSFCIDFFDFDTIQPTQDSQT